MGKSCFFFFLGGGGGVIGIYKYMNTYVHRYTYLYVD